MKKLSETSKHKMFVTDLKGVSPFSPTRSGSVKSKQSMNNPTQLLTTSCSLITLIKITNH